MEATLKFSLPEENHQYRAAIDGEAYRAVISEVDNYLRNQEKYGDLHMVDTGKAIRTIRKFIEDTLDDHNLKIN